MNLKPINFPKPDWSPKPNDNAVGIEGRLLMRNQNLMIAQLRFSKQATFDAHTAPWDCDVLCLEGSGFVRVGDETFALTAGQSVHWPKQVMHQLWTEDSEMLTEMIEHLHQMKDPASAWAEHLQSS